MPEIVFLKNCNLLLSYSQSNDSMATADGGDPSTELECLLFHWSRFHFIFIFRISSELCWQHLHSQKSHSLQALQYVRVPYSSTGSRTNLAGHLRGQHKNKNLSVKPTAVCLFCELECHLLWRRLQRNYGRLFWWSF